MDEYFDDLHLYEKPKSGIGVNMSSRTRDPTIESKPKSKGKSPIINNKDDVIKVVVKGARGQPDEIVSIPRLIVTWSTFLNKSVILYGGSGSGKTTVMTWIMNIMKSLFALVFAFAPTNAEKHEIDKFIDPACVLGTFGVQQISRIYQRQKAASEIYTIANRQDILHKLFMQIADREAKDSLTNLHSYKQKIICTIKSSRESPGAIKARLDEVEELFKNKIIKFYKTVINTRINMFDTDKLDETSKQSLIYRNFNPRTLVVFSDATNELLEIIKEGKKLAKKANSDAVEGDVVSNFFFKGRWANITHIYEFHDDSGLDPRIRKNAFYSIFTEKSTALGFFGKGANGFSRREQRIAEDIISTVFDENKSPKHAKLVYKREEKKFYYIVAEKLGEFTMGSDLLRKYCNRVRDTTERMDTKNPYYSRFNKLNKACN